VIVLVPLICFFLASPTFLLVPLHRRIDAELQARDAGNGGAVRELRRLHLTGMAANLVQLAAVIGMVPAVV
jgi:hypothetical protein